MPATSQCAFWRTGLLFLDDKVGTTGNDKKIEGES